MSPRKKKDISDRMRTISVKLSVEDGKVCN